MKNTIQKILQISFLLLVFLTIEGCVPMQNGRAARFSIQELDEYSITLCCDAYVESNRWGRAMNTLAGGLDGKKRKTYRRNICGVKDLLAGANEHFGHVDGEESAKMIRMFKKVAGSTVSTEGDINSRWDNSTTVNTEGRVTLDEVTCATFTKY